MGKKRQFLHILRDYKDGIVRVIATSYLGKTDQLLTFRAVASGVRLVEGDESRRTVAVAGAAAVDVGRASEFI